MTPSFFDAVLKSTTEFEERLFKATGDACISLCVYQEFYAERISPVTLQHSARQFVYLFVLKEY